MLNKRESKRSLFIATPSSILIHSSSGSGFEQSIAFKCGAADGIVNAIPAQDNSGLIAVADSHLVLLHELNRGEEKEYRLKSGFVSKESLAFAMLKESAQGEPRLLRFSPSSCTLYFSTTLSPAIQIYSIASAELLPPLHSHSSAPSVLALSSDGEVLLSASRKPPTIHIRDVRAPGTVPISIQPRTTISAATCCTFQTEHPVSTCDFLLGFGDGTLGAYRLVIPTLREDGPTNGRTRSCPLRQPSEIGCIKKLHKAAMGGVCAVEFIPGFGSRAISVGHDGKCRIVDFSKGSRVLRTWYVPAPATCLSITSNRPTQRYSGKERVVFFQAETAPDDHEYPHESFEILVAIGTQAGNVLVFNMLGLQVREIAIGAPVLHLEWVGDMSAPSMLPPPRTPTSQYQPITTASPDESSTPSDEEGTVRKANLLHPGLNSTLVPLAQNNLFSSLSSLRPSSDVSYGSPEKHRHKRPYPRPRIVTNTFLDPESHYPTRETKPSTSSAAAKHHISPPPSPLSDLDSDDIWKTPPTHPRRNSFFPLSPHSTALALDAAPPSPHADSTPPRRRSSLLRSPPRLLDGEAGSSSARRLSSLRARLRRVKKAKGVEDSVYAVVGEEDEEVWWEEWRELREEVRLLRGEVGALKEAMRGLRGRG
ncbi:hypothetical protein EJ04DRAFT_595011 [Polyplosphaeria fusca]|uniref:Uncharacterized protein n=1 Tax=Polyplosphaeria fusca TaxID=682080 RepID=A0A9P4QM64_9PLEO|nr:hypothetical protein EJ04DRAFT_595011 [Polyplosphaeria fusca]